MAEKILRMTIGLFVGVWVARYLGPEQFGLLSYAQSFVFLFIAIATLGLDGIVVRELVKDESRRDVLLGSAFGLKLLGAFLILPILFVAIHFTDSNAYTSLLIFIIASSTIFQSFNVIDFYYQSTVQAKFVAFANSISLVLSSVIKIMLILYNAPLYAFAIIILFESIVLALGLIYFYKKQTHHRLREWSFRGDVAKSLLRDSWPLIFAGIAISINMRIDQIMLKELLGVKSVGIYAAAVKVAEVCIMIPHLIGKSVFPSYINAHKSDLKLFLYRMRVGYRNLFYLSFLIAIVIYLSSEFIITMMFGALYQEAIPVLQVTIITILFASIGAMNAIYLRVMNLQKKIMNRQWSNVLINVLLNYFFIKWFGIIGAIYATALAAFISTVIYDFFDKDLHDMNMAKLAILGYRGKYE